MSSLYTFIYASQASTELDDQELGALLEVARSCNGAQHVTGMLIYAYGSFLQQLEGTREALDPIIQSITVDPRHQHIRRFSDHAIPRRQYDDWAMGFAHPDQASLSDTVPGYRLAAGAPLIQSDLIPTASIAEMVLRRYATADAESALR